MSQQELQIQNLNSFINYSHLIVKFNKFIKILNESSDPQDFDEYLQIISDQENFKVDGYYFEKDSKEKFTGVLHLFVTDFEQDKNKLQETLNLSDVNKIFKKTERFRFY